MDLDDFLAECRQLKRSSKPIPKCPVYNEDCKLVIDRTGVLRIREHGRYDRLPPTENRHCGNIVNPVNLSKPVTLPKLEEPPLRFAYSDSLNIHYNFAKPFVAVEYQQACEVVESTPALEISCSTCDISILNSLSSAVGLKKSSENTNIIRGKPSSPVQKPCLARCECAFCLQRYSDELFGLRTVDGSEQLVRVELRREPIQFDCTVPTPRALRKYNREVTNVYVYNESGVEVVAAPRTAAECRLVEALRHSEPYLGARPILTVQRCTFVGRAIRFYLFELGLRFHRVSSLRSQAMGVLRWLVRPEPPP